MACSPLPQPRPWQNLVPSCVLSFLPPTQSGPCLMLSCVWGLPAGAGEAGPAGLMGCLGLPTGKDAVPERHPLSPACPVLAPVVRGPCVSEEQPWDLSGTRVGRGAPLSRAPGHFEPSHLPSCNHRNWPRPRETHSGWRPSAGTCTASFPYTRCLCLPKVTGTKPVMPRVPQPHNPRHFGPAPPSQLYVFASQGRQQGWGW